MFEWLVPPCMKHVKTSTLSVPYSELLIFNSMLTILKATLGVYLEQVTIQQGQPGSQQAASGQGQQEQQVLQGADTIHIQMAFLFAIIWGVCSTITGKFCRPMFPRSFGIVST